MTEIPNNENYDGIDGKVQIFSNTDERLKFLGKILTNDSSRNILLLLIEKEMTANEIATKMNVSLPLTLYHINQMISAEIVVICKTINNNKNHPMKYYTAKSAILILPEKVIEKAKNSKSLSRSLKSIMKFAVIGIVGSITWLGTISMKSDKILVNRGSSDIHSNEIINILSNFLDQIIIFSIPIIVTSIVIGSGLFLMWYSKKKKN